MLCMAHLIISAVKWQYNDVLHKDKRIPEKQSPFFRSGQASGSETQETAFDFFDGSFFRMV